MSELASPLLAFLRECCEMDPRAKAPKDAVWDRYTAFLMERSLAFTYSDSNMFHRDLEVAAQYRITQARSAFEGRQAQCWVGLRLKDVEAESLP